MSSAASSALVVLSDCREDDTIKVAQPLRLPVDFPPNTDLERFRMLEQGGVVLGVPSPRAGKTNHSIGIVEPDEVVLTFGIVEILWWSDIHHTRPGTYRSQRIEPCERPRQ